METIGIYDLTVRNGSDSRSLMGLQTRWHPGMLPYESLTGVGESTGLPLCQQGVLVPEGGLVSLSLGLCTDWASWEPSRWHTKAVSPSWLALGIHRWALEVDHYLGSELDFSFWRKVCQRICRKIFKTLKWLTIITMFCVSNRNPKLC
jgi:hypothetical protein